MRTRKVNLTDEPDRSAFAPLRVAIDEGDASESHGFVASPVDPLTVMIAVAEAVKIMGASWDDTLPRKL
jgi:hypothetical protein